MIAPNVRAQFSTYRGQPLIPCNVCCRCGEYDDPETTARWPLDDDGDRICRECARAINNDTIDDTQRSPK